MVTSWGVRFISCSSVPFGEKGSSRGHVNKKYVGVGVLSDGEGCGAFSVAGWQWSAVCCEARDRQTDGSVSLVSKFGGVKIQFVPRSKHTPRL